MTKYAIIPAPGFSGNVAKTVSVHRTLKAAQKARAGCRSWAIIETSDNDRKGSTVYMDTFAGHKFCADGVLRK